MIYDYKCPNGHIVTLHRKMDERNDLVTCSCGEEMTLKIGCPTIGTAVSSDKWADMHEKEAKRPDPVNLTHY